LLHFSYDGDIHSCIACLRFWGKSSEGRGGFFLWLIFKFQQCFSEIGYCTFNW